MKNCASSWLFTRISSSSTGSSDLRCVSSKSNCFLYPLPLALQTKGVRFYMVMSRNGFEPTVPVFSLLEDIQYIGGQVEWHRRHRMSIIRTTLRGTVHLHWRKMTRTKFLCYAYIYIIYNIYVYIYIFVFTVFCIVCIFSILFLLCIFILICLVCTSVRTIATEWQLNCSE